MSRKRPSKKDREKLKREETVPLPTGEAKIRVYEDGAIMSTSAGWGSEGIAQAETNAIAGLGRAETQMLRKKTEDEQTARGKARKGAMNKNTQFLADWVNDEYDDFLHWWAANDSKNKSDRYRLILKKLVPNPTRSDPNGTAEISNEKVLINGKQLTVDKIRRVVERLLKSSSET